tara:strand:+ start:305 stop:487 length:183 start_codon:yes stop_codon:yes gene_type:complete
MQQWIAKYKSKVSKIWSNIYFWADNAKEAHEWYSEWMKHKDNTVLDYKLERRQPENFDNK